MTNLIKLIENHASFVPAQRGYISLYRHSRCYGGPEEGGWWYSTYELMGYIPFASIEQAEAARTALEEQASIEAAAERAAHRLSDEAMWARVDRGEDIEDDFCSGEEGDTTFVVYTEERLGENDNTNEPPPHWE